MTQIDDLVDSKPKTFGEWEAIRRKSPHLYYQPNIQNKIFRDRKDLGEQGFYGKLLEPERDVLEMAKMIEATEADAKEYQRQRGKREAERQKGPLPEPSRSVFGKEECDE